MHACLNVDEILRLIASELVVSQGGATAVALACCCKSFEDPVLDTLWETQYQLFPLLESLPGDIWKDGKRGVSAPTTYVFSSLNYFIPKYFKRLPTTLECTRFRKYAQRMRSFKVPGDLKILSSELFSVLQLRTTGGLLLPNLKSLHLWYTNQEFIPFIKLFLSPQTTAITIAFEFMGPGGLPPAAVASIITTFPTLCPNLREITLPNLPRDPRVVAAVSGMLSPPIEIPSDASLWILELHEGPLKWSTSYQTYTSS